MPASSLVAEGFRMICAPATAWCAPGGNGDADSLPISMANEYPAAWNTPSVTNGACSPAMSAVLFSGSVHEPANQWSTKEYISETGPCVYGNLVY